MKITQITMLKADDGMVLVKNGTYTSGVLLKEGEIEEGWTEITQEEYNEILKLEEEKIQQELKEYN